MRARVVGLVALAGVGAAVAVALGWAEVLAVSIGVLVLLAVTAFLRLPRAATWADVATPVRVTRGDEADVVIDVTVPHGPTTWVSAVDDSGRTRTWLPRDGAGIELRWPVDTSRRGLFPVGPTRLEAGDPFGLRRRVLATRTATAVLVVPRVHAADPATARGRLADGTAPDQDGSDQFHSLREYVVGDPIKLVHWPTSARTGTLMVRRMVETTVPWLLLVLDVNARAYDTAGALFADFDANAFEDTVDAVASWAWWACGPHQRVLLTTTSLTAPTVEVAAGTRESALDALATVDPVPADECGAARVGALARRRGVGRIVLITGRRTETSAAWLAMWRRIVPTESVVGHA